MVTVLEEAMDLTDSLLSTSKLLLEHGIADPDVMNVVYGMRHTLEVVANLLALVEIEDAEVPDTPVESNVEDNGKPTITKNITYEELMSKQYLENEHPEPTETIDTAPKVDLKQVHQLRMQGKTAKEIATSFGVSVSTAYRWLDDIKKNRPMWAQDWVKSKVVKE